MRVAELKRLVILVFKSEEIALLMLQIKDLRVGQWKECYNLKLELKLHLGKDLREVKGIDRSGKA